MLDRAARLVKPGGRVVYITCSVLPEENDEAVGGFLEGKSGFRVQKPRDVIAASGLHHLTEAVRLTRHGLQMTPFRTRTDGFYVAILQRE